MKRNFPSFLDAYCEYAANPYVPEQYILWSGVSVLSGALERKVWLKEGPVLYYPNLFIFLVGNPGTGKSSAIKPAANLLTRLSLERNQQFKVLSGLVTQAGLCEKMSDLSVIHNGPEVMNYSSIWYHEDEGSDSGFKNLGGDFTSTVTKLYDCPKVYEKTLKDRNFEIPHPSFSVLCGTTFDFLKTLVNHDSVMGGLASRVAYVVFKEKKKKHSSLGKDDEYARNLSLENKLLDDLTLINQLQGSFRAAPEALRVYSEWYDSFQDAFHALTSERMQSIEVRKPTLLKKILMVLSVSERGDLGITKEHMERGIKMTEEVTRDNTEIISSAIIANKNNQESINQFLLSAIEKSGGESTVANLKKKYLSYGGDLSKFDPTLKTMVEAELLIETLGGGGRGFKLLVDPNSNL